MFKKGQLVRSQRNNKTYVVLGRTHGELVWAAHARHMVGFWLSTRCLKLIGNNYKEKPRDAIQERRDSYK